MLSVFFVSFAADGVLLSSAADYKKGVVIKDGLAQTFDKGNYIGFAGVDLTGKNSVEMKATAFLRGWTNGAGLRIMLDNPMTGEQIGTIVVSKEKEIYSAYITPSSGTHDVYFVSMYNLGDTSRLSVESFEFKSEAYADTALDEQVPDSAIVDYYADTWVATDSVGRKVADYSETGAPKQGQREVGMMYWTWFTSLGASEARIISELISEYPDAMKSQTSDAWKTYGAVPQYFWDEPALGFYNSYDYFVYCRHMEMLSAAGVDAIFLDLSNGGIAFVPTLVVLAEAMRDSKRNGVDIPRLSLFNWNSGKTMTNLATVLYNVGFIENDWSDIWYYYDGKPFIFSIDDGSTLIAEVGDRSSADLKDVLADHFSWRGHGTSRDPENLYRWEWCESFPQMQRGVAQDDGRPEMVAVGVAHNESYVLGRGKSHITSEPYAKGRNYSAAFSEDLSSDGIKNAPYFQEEARLALDADPHIIYVDGWNELSADLQPGPGFVDTFDNAHSRDFEPVKGELEDIYYMLLTDFIRKYKGVRQAPVAGAEATIAVDGAVTDWDAVTPAFYNYSADDRNNTSGFKLRKTGENAEYKTNSGDRVIYSKASRDGANLYFMAKGKEGASLAATTLYINADRNPATGFNGYNFIIGRNGTDAVESIGADGSFTFVATAQLVRNGNVLEIAVPRAALGLTGTLDVELKWVDGTFNEIIDLYEQQNTAPIGRFNYLYTEIAQKALTDSERSAVSDSVILKAGKNQMIASGAIVTVDESNTTIAPFEMNSTLYIPVNALTDILGYGRSKTYYDAISNIFYFYQFKMNDELTEITETNWYYTTVGSYESRANGYLKPLSNASVAANGTIYLPVSIFAECMGLNVTSLGNGIYSIGTASAESVNSVAHYLA